MTNIKILKRLYRDYTKKFLPKILIAFLFSLVLAGSTSSIAYLLDPAIEKIFINKDQTLIIIIPVVIIIAFAAKGISLYGAKVIMIGISEEIRKTLQMDMMKSLIKADTDFIEKKHSGKIIGNLINDVNFMTGLVSVAILNLFKDTLTLIGLMSVMFYQNWKLSLIAVIMIPLASFAAKSLGKRIGKVVNQQMSRAGELNTYLIEVFKNHKLTKIFQREQYENKRAVEFLNSLKETSKKIGIVFVRASPIMEFLTGIMIAILIFIAARLISNNELEVSNFFSFLAAMMLAYQPVRSLATLNIAVQQGLAAAKKVLPIIDSVPTVRDKKNTKNLKINDGTITFNDVEFNYTSTADKKVLKKINLNMPGQKITALVGLSGSGKTTILNLIPRFYNIDSGDILIDNQSIYDTSIYSLRKEISLVSQDTTLFDDTIKNNILYANSQASDEEIMEVAEKSFSHNFIKDLPNKYETIIGENGLKLSGGEKQRISIARAMLKKAPIILLDEATSSLDAETESKIQEAMSLLTKNKTTIVIAHRLSTILNSHKIYVIEKGEVVAQGNHKELIDNSKIYKNFYDKQVRRD